MKILLTVCCLVLLSFQKQDKITVYLVGDSTMADKEISRYPETGWGMAFRYFFDSTVRVENHAKNGRSTKTFLAEKRWDSIMKTLKAGDYVFIQFGHNDEVKTKASYTTPEEYTTNLTRYIQDTRSKKAYPILLTPVARRRFESNGKVEGTHEEYAALVRTLAKKLNTPLIDHDKSSQQLLQDYGTETSKLFFLQLKPGEHPNYPNGVDDNTHFSELGARLMAQLVLADLRNLNPDLIKHVVNQQ